ncbi:MAG: 3-hydroxyacyl-CoA dehydrogenase [Sphingomonadales bacterium]|nr:3-hydroxyacyl-CoA dehydrogenase [Sphingomonadales bacterium]MBU3991007.1 enoyl-CoA hydratase/isomerase family protein [Alphaproteobacteria bacterium]
MAAISEGTDLTIEDGVAVITLDYPPVNAMSPALMDGLYDALTAALADDGAKAIVLICAGRTFIAGADLKSMGKVKPKVDFFGLQEAVENSAKPTVAALHGTALGGGLETALTFHYRIATPSARMGLPEVTLGLLPGGGGTQRLPRITGAEAALELMLTGKQMTAKNALAIGLIDRIASGEDSLRADAIAFAKELAASGKAPQRIRDIEDKVAADRADPGLMDRLRAKWARKIAGLDAPQAIFRCVEAALKGPWEAGLAVERKEFQGVLNGPQSAALRHIFMAERAAQKIPGLAPDLQQLPVRKVGVVGAGTMGGGIAMVFLGAGLPVTLVETTQEALDRGIAGITKTLNQQVERGRLKPEQVAAQLSALAPTLDPGALADADLVVEAIFENMSVKKDLFARLGAIVRPDAILATNTSFLNVDEIAGAAPHPERVIGMHFFSPAHIMRLLEVVRGAKTADAVLATVLTLARKLGKAPAVSGVCHGFIANRILGARQAPANHLVSQGVAPAAIDAASVDFGFPMGPFQMLDLAGLDVAAEADTSGVIPRLVTAGRRGQKGGGGFYDYDEKRTPTPSPAALAIIAEVTGQRPGSKQLANDQIMTALLFPMVNEGARILEEGIALKASDIDLVTVLGFGFPAHKGGLMFWADAVGLGAIVAGLKAAGIADISPLLEKLAGEGGKFNAG